MEKEKENLYAILCYMWILSLIPIILKKEGDFIKFHARQGILLFIVEVGLGIIGIIPFLGHIVYLLGMVICGLASIMGIMQVLMGNKWKMPVIGQWAEKINI